MTRSPLTDAHALLALAEAASPGKFREAEFAQTDEWLDCPLCGGEGNVDGSTYINYDDKAVGIQFFGVGDSFRENELFYEGILKLAPALARDVIAMAEEVERLRAALLRISDPKQADRGDIARAALSGKASETQTKGEVGC